MEEKIKNILKIVGIWYLITFALWVIIILGTFLILNTFDAEVRTYTNYAEILVVLGYSLIIPVQILISSNIIYSPTIISLYFLFKRFNELKTRIWLTAFVFAINNIIYIIIEHLLTQQHTLSLIMVLLVANLVIPTVMIAVLVIPKKILPYKKEIIISTVLIYVLCMGFIIATNFVIEKIGMNQDKKLLEKYEIVIESIENHKTKYGGYPYEIPKIKDLPQNDEDNYPYYKYGLRNESKDYVLIIQPSSNVQYHYCSNKTFEECQDGWHNHRIQRKFGKWTRSILDDD